MSRKKKSKSLPGAPPAVSFRKIRDQIKKKHAGSMPLNWFAATKRGKKIYHFPYRVRHQLLLDICGTYEIKTKIPSKWSEIFSKGLSSSSKEGRLFCDVMLKITDEEFRTGKLENKTFNGLKKSLKIGKKDITKPSIEQLILLVQKSWLCSTGLSSAIAILKTERTRNSITKVHVSCDPWDIARMGAGKLGMGSCVNFLDGGNTNLLFSNFQDSNMVIAYTEDDKERFQVDAMKARVMIRLLKSEGRYGIVLDKVYGNTSYRMAFASMIKMAAKRAGIRMWEFKTYNHKDSQTSYVDRTNGHNLVGAGVLNSYRNHLPYLDQSQNGGWLKFKNNGKNLSALYTFRLVEDDE